MTAPVTASTNWLLHAGARPVGEAISLRLVSTERRVTVQMTPEQARHLAQQILQAVGK